MHYALSLRRPTRRRQLLDANQPSSRPCETKVNGAHKQQEGPPHSSPLHSSILKSVCASPPKNDESRGPMQQLTEQEKKRIQRYCTYPKIAATTLVMSFVACLLMLPLQMINDIVFHQKEFQPAGIYTAITLTAIELAIFCYCALAPRFGMQGKQWKELQNRLAVAQTNKDRSAEVASVLATQAAGRLLKNSDNDLARNLGGAAEVAGAVGAVATAADVLAETASNAEAMANACGVTIPSVKKQIIALAVVPVIVLLGVYIPH